MFSSQSAWELEQAELRATVAHLEQRVVEARQRGTEAQREAERSTLHAVQCVRDEREDLAVAEARLVAVRNHEICI